MAKYKEQINNHVNLDYMKTLIVQYTDLGLWSAALFWADKVLAVSKKDGGNEVWLVAKSLLHKGDWHRAVFTVTSRGLHKTHLLCHYVAVKALIEAKEYQQALQMMTDNDTDQMEHNLHSMPQNRVQAALNVALGMAHAALESRGAASEALMAALRIDVTCYTALELLLEHHADTPDKESEFLESLPLETQCQQPEAAVISSVYGSYINRYGDENIKKPKEQSQVKGQPPWEEDVHTIMERSTDTHLARARRLLHAGSWKESQTLLDSLGPWFGERERVVCMVELHQIPQLFHYAHTLVDKYPHRAVSWFAVGCYYFAIGKNEFARRYLSKAKSLEPGMGEAWLAYGHSFAADNEHDQAMAAYFKACQLLPGCHLPCLYIAVECAQLNNFAMSERFVARAAGLDQVDTLQDKPGGVDENATGAHLILIAESRLTRHIDPHVTHEAGAIAYAVGNYRDAEALFKKALKDVKKAHNGQVPPRWYVLLDNLGHACRKNGRLEESIAYHEEGLSCKPGRGKAYSALGLSYALLGNTEKAIDLLHCALAKNPDDGLTFSMLNELIDEFADIGEKDSDVPSMDFSIVQSSLSTEASVSLDVTSHQPIDSQFESGGGGDGTNVSDMSMSFD